MPITNLKQVPEEVLANGEKECSIIVRNLLKENIEKEFHTNLVIKRFPIFS